MESKSTPVVIKKPLASKPGITKIETSLKKENISPKPDLLNRTLKNLNTRSSPVKLTQNQSLLTTNTKLKTDTKSTFERLPSKISTLNQTSCRTTRVTSTTAARK